MGNVCIEQNGRKTNDIWARASTTRRNYRKPSDLDSPTSGGKNVDLSTNDGPDIQKTKKFSCEPIFETRELITIENFNNQFENYIFNQTNEDLIRLYKIEQSKISQNETKTSNNEETGENTSSQDNGEHKQAKK